MNAFIKLVFLFILSIALFRSTISAQFERQEFVNLENDGEGDSQENVEILRRSLFENPFDLYRRLNRQEQQADKRKSNRPFTIAFPALIRTKKRVM
ncbi:unnamed protein product [Didymodactylos carnosus]|uniref:Uncharacterized protein n=1 Tax=Didymodactylos carnosus TaxID=1234261 RepID=A0A814BTZ4_9BILA|nr:unnamed protein product [Didymodactylos carnosus]CAF0933475.1 unnamed protein product [Didymodactylos carnosus]CAF3533325.1 unnamed protein product [Didymodactylos carnosus]CAF3711081.1 unnamed protein product [Didymodactylos carnosus]